MDRQGPSRLEVRADWNDVEASMDVAAPRAELAVLSTEALEHGASLRFSVVTTTDEYGEITARRDGHGPSDGENIPIVLEARIGRFGDPTRERLILNALARRLDQLHAKATAPLDW